MIMIIWLYNIALNRTPNIDCYWGGTTQGLGFRFIVWEDLMQAEEVLQKGFP